MTRSSVPPPVTAVLDAAERLAARRGWPRSRTGCAELAAGHGAALGGRPRPPSTPGASGCARSWCCSRRRRARASGRSAPPPPSSCVHMATLVHDDVLDAAPLRRGRPTVVAPLGPGPRRRRRRPALLAGVRRARGRRRRAPRSPSSAAASVALALGELAQRRDAFDTSITEERYLRRCSLKTARLFESACRVGRLASGAPGTEQLASFGREIGLAFQLLDDVLDVTGPPGAHRQGPRHRPARRHGDPAADPRAPARPGARVRSSSRGLDPDAAEEICDRIAATGRPRPGARPRQGRDRARQGDPRVGATSRTRSASCSG